MNTNDVLDLFQTEYVAFRIDFDFRLVRLLIVMLSTQTHTTCMYRSVLHNTLHGITSYGGKLVWMLKHFLMQLL